MGAVPEPHPIRLVIRDDLRRSRLTVFFRFLLAFPHFVWLSLWSVAAVFAAVGAWFAALATGRVPTALHRFLAAYVRYAMHVHAFTYVIGGKFPGFAGQEGSYGIDVQIAAPAPQRRWAIALRLVLAVPALLLTSALVGLVLPVLGLLAWWAAFVTGRMPRGLRNFGATCLRYGAQAYAYLFLLTDRYPGTSLVPEPPDDEPEPVGPWLDRVAILILVGLAAGAALIGVLLLRSSLQGEPTTGSLRVLAPAGGCWSVGLGRSEEDLGARTESGCGTRSIDVEVDEGLEAQFAKRPSDATWDLGAKLVVDGEVVREVTPARFWGLRIRYGDDLPTKTIEVRIGALDGGCWTATIDAGKREGCGDWRFDLDVEGSANMVFERREPGSWAFDLALVADGRTVQTVGPTTRPDSPLGAAYVVPSEDG